MAFKLIQREPASGAGEYYKLSPPSLAPLTNSGKSLSALLEGCMARKHKQRI